MHVCVLCVCMYVCMCVFAEKRSPDVVQVNQLDNHSLLVLLESKKIQSSPSSTFFQCLYVLCTIIAAIIFFFFSYLKYKTLPERFFMLRERPYRSPSAESRINATGLHCPGHRPLLSVFIMDLHPAHVPSAPHRVSTRGRPGGGDEEQQGSRTQRDHVRL